MTGDISGYKKIRVTIIGFIFFILCSIYSYADSEQFWINSFEYIEDISTSFEDILSGKYNSSFHSSDSGNFNFGIISHPVWIRFKVSGDSCSDCAISVNSPGLKSADIYFPVIDGSSYSYEHHEGGLSSDYSELDWHYRFMIYDLPENPDKDQWVYFYFNSGGHTANFTIDLIEAEKLRYNTWMEMLILNLCIGILLAMLLYNTSLFLFLGDRTYLFYVIYLLSMCVYQICHSGIGRIIGIPVLINYSIPSSALAYILALVFAQQFLNTKNLTPLLHWFMYAVMAVSSLAMVLSLSGNTGAANQITHVIGLIVPLTMVLVGIVRSIQGYLPARYYLAAWGVLCLSIMILTMTGMNLIPYNFITYNIHSLGSAIEAILLSMALGDRVRVLQDKRKKLEEKEHKLEELTITDELTGLYNKRAYTANLPIEIRAAEKDGTDLSLIVLDIDHFKELNDNYGHIAGDYILSQLGRLIIESIRDKDIACRYGGDEFVIILPGISLISAGLIAERLRKTVAESIFHLADGTDLSCTLSVGVAFLESNDDVFSLFNRADSALYEAKESGRNMVCFQKMPLNSDM